MREGLPKGWANGKLNEIVFSVRTGVQEYTGKKEYYSTGSIQKNCYISEGSYTYQKRPSRANRLSKLNDILQARMKETDKGLLINEEISEQLFSTGFFQLRAYGDTYSTKLLYYFIKSHDFINQRDRLCTGSTQEALTDAKAKELIFPLPPLNEQKRIAAKLDHIMPKIDAVKERLDRIPKIIKRFRQSILTAVVTGKLTEMWREEHPDVGSAEINFSPIINKNKLSKKEYTQNWRKFIFPNKWSCVYLKDIAKLRLGKMLNKSKNKGKKVAYLRNLNVRWMDFDLTDISTLFAQDEEIEKLTIQNGDVLICEGGEPGRSATWKLGKNDFVFQKALHRARLINGVEPDWLVYNLKIDADINKLDDLFTGTTIKHLTGRSLAKYPIPLPPIEEQREIVRQVDRLFAFADKLEEHYKRAKEKIDKLPRSVLAKAFRGELVPQDPNDEPAEKLLERIKQEKESLKATTNPREKKNSKQRLKKRG